jgi:hypothetical protein
MQLADGEQLITEVPLGPASFSGTLALTDRRLLASAPGFEESIPLKAVASVRSAYLRDFSAIIVGAILLIVGLSFGSAYKSLETAINSLAYSAQRRFSDKTPPAADQADSDVAYGRYINVPAGLIWVLMLPLLGWGGYKVYRGVVGETELVVGTAAGEFRRLRDGRRGDMLDFVEEVGRRLP